MFNAKLKLICYKQWKKGAFILRSSCLVVASINHFVRSNFPFAKLIIFIKIQTVCEWFIFTHFFAVSCQSLVLNLCFSCCACLPLGFLIALLVFYLHFFLLLKSTLKTHVMICCAQIMWSLERLRRIICSRYC